MNTKPGRILVTGGAGFVGRHLVAALKRAYPDAELYVAGRHPCLDTGPDAGLASVSLDITDAAAVGEMVVSLQPDVVFHLAAQANVAGSFSAPEETWRVNLNGSLNLFSALDALGRKVLLFNVGSADMYGGTFRYGRVDESSVLEPMNPYAASKAAADLAACALASTSRVHVVRLRPFNHSGAGQSENFVLPAFAAQVARIEAGVQEPVLSVGDLSAERDFLHVEDVVSAYLAVMSVADEIPSGTVVNVCSGTPRSVESLLEIMLDYAKTKIEVVQDPARMRRSDIPLAVGSNDYLKAVTGWVPQYAAEDLVHAVLDDWRQRVRDGGAAR